MKKNRINYHIKSIKKALIILNSFNYDKYEMDLEELSKIANLPKSTARRILITLEDENMIVKNKNNDKYRLGIRLFHFGQIVKSKLEVKSIALPTIRELAHNTGETVELFFLSGEKRVSLEKIEGPLDTREETKLVKILPLYAGAPGKAILAFLPQERINRIITKEKLIPLGPKTITDPEKLRNNLQEIKREGYAISLEEIVPGWCSIAAPIFNEYKEIVASIGVSGASIRFSEGKKMNIISLVKEAANKISTSIGF